MPAYRPVPDRFWEKVRFDPPHGCWPWQAQLTPDGYGRFQVAVGQSRLAHRVAWNLLVGPIPAGLTVDHLCHHPSTCAGGPSCPHRACVNPRHMELVPALVNNARGIRAGGNACKTHCPAGHAYTPENTYTYRGQRYCRACKQQQRRH